MKIYLRTIIYFAGLLIYLGKLHRLILASPVYCATRLVCVFSSSLCGVYVKRAKITCFILIILSVIYNIPHMFLYLDRGYDCIPYGSNMGTLGLTYYWLSFVINFSFPFVALLIMNSVIIHTIRTRKSFTAKSDTERQSKTSEKQMFIILLLVTFSFLILTTPAYIYFLLSAVLDINKTLKIKASFALFYSIDQKLWYSNNGINFFLYILSGTKFRNDFKNMFPCKNRNQMNVLGSDKGTKSGDSSVTTISKTTSMATIGSNDATHKDQEIMSF